MYSSVLLYINSNPRTTFRTRSSGDGGTGGNSNTNNSEIISPSEELSESQLSESQLRYIPSSNGSLMPRPHPPRGETSPGHETTVMGSELQLSEYVPSLVPTTSNYSFYLETHTDWLGNEATIYTPVTQH